MEITLITTFDLSQDITLDAYSDTDKVGTAVVKNEELTYYNLFANKIVKYDKDNLQDFVDFVDEYQLTFKKVADRKWIKYNLILRTTIQVTVQSELIVKLRILNGMMLMIWLLSLVRRCR